MISRLIVKQQDRFYRYSRLKGVRNAGQTPFTLPIPP